MTPNNLKSELHKNRVKDFNDISLFLLFAIMLGVDVKKNVIITISSDKGLCGGINSTSVKISKAFHNLSSGTSWKQL
jgi:F-type H+-transporting ATPase subunit gamma